MKNGWMLTIKGYTIIIFMTRFSLMVNYPDWIWVNTTSSHGNIMNVSGMISQKAGCFHSWNQYVSTEFLTNLYKKPGELSAEKKL